MKYLIGPALAVLLMASPTYAAPRSLSGFTAIEAQGNFETNITRGDRFSVDVTGSEADRVQTVVRDGALHIQARNRPLFGREPELDAVVTITLPRLDRVSVSRGQQARIDDVRAGDLHVTASMGGQLSINGVCERLDISASMGGSADARGLACAQVDADASMGGSMSVQSMEAISASASMGGSISISGEPQRRSTSASMGGSVSFR